MSHKKLRQGLIETCIAMNESGLNQGTSGNLSHRIEGGMLITPTSMPYDQMKNDDIVEMAFDGTVTGKHRPSSEWRFHRDILRKRSDVNVVLHTHSVYCTTLATHGRGIPSFHYMVAVAGGTDIRCAPYACFGTQELSTVALEALKDRTACLLGHHGLIVLAETYEKAMWRAIEIETLAKMYVHALAIGEPPHLSEKEMAQVIEQMRRMAYGDAPDLDKVKDTPKLPVARSASVAPDTKAEKPARQYPKALKVKVTVKSPANSATKLAPVQGTVAGKAVAPKESAKTVAAPKAASPKTRSTKALATKATTPAKKTIASKKKATTEAAPVATGSAATSFKSLVGSALSRRK